jgi:hypothetical protein
MSNPFGVRTVNQQPVSFGSSISMPLGASPMTAPSFGGPTASTTFYRPEPTTTFGAPSNFGGATAFSDSSNNGENKPPTRGAPCLTPKMSNKSTFRSASHQPLSAFAPATRPQTSLEPVSAFENDAMKMRSQLVKMKSDSFALTMKNRYDFYKCAGKFLHKRQQLQNAGRPHSIKVAFHYTNQTNVDSIGETGFQISRSFGGTFGKGIYVGNNPYAFRNFGGTGMMVLILSGSQKRVSFGPTEQEQALFDSVVGNKLTMGHTEFFDEIVLKCEEQVLPLFHFQYENVWMDDLVLKMQKKVQEWANASLRGRVPFVEMIPDAHDEEYVESYGNRLDDVNMRTGRSDTKTKTRDVPELPPCFVGKPLILPAAPAKPQVCLIGFDNYTPKSGQAGTGACPAGSVTVKESTKDTCAGAHSPNKTLILTYFLQGQQGGCETYLPDNRQGRRLMKRLIKAFVSGLTFKMENNVPMFNIHQKSVLNGEGRAAWPDENFITATNARLDDLKVPRD